MEKKKVTLNFILLIAAAVNYARNSGGKFFTSSEGNKNPAGGDSSEIGGWLGENPLQDEVF
ncbi:Protein CBG27993 [Caenorhabditis briggsae]|uniref:Protein CBG27993 n=1 Tax=Caenorhabditis briggsae TaxID=6238 RepID=B6IM54_CAEBR|nr:Protein CBG27993 [Caenorhabditis briggsae]CAS00984.1 Protein CBG27993 [Caenorhabditis briggsae]